jgi:hypothetical protein
MAGKLIVGYLLLCFVVPGFLPKPWGLVFVVGIFVAFFTHLATAQHYDQQARAREREREIGREKSDSPQQ